MINYQHLTITLIVIPSLRTLLFTYLVWGGGVGLSYILCPYNFDLFVYILVLGLFLPVAFCLGYRTVLFSSPPIR
jgi:hypothetical protein